MTLLDAFWDATVAVDDAAPRERAPFGSEAELGDLWDEAGLRQVETAALDVEAPYDDFDELWSSFLLGVGPAGGYLIGLEPAQREAVRDEFRERIGEPAGSFTLGARAWAVRGRVPDA